MEQIMKSLEDPELLNRLAVELRDEDEEQKAFEKRLRARESVPVMAEVDRRPKMPRHNPVLQQVIRRSLGRNR